MTLSADGKKAVLEKEGKTLVATLLSPKNAAFTVMDALPLASSLKPEQNTKNAGIRKLAVHITDVKNATIAVEFTQASGQKKTVVSPLSQW